MAINVKQIQELRERTGAGMMDCKKALEHAEGDTEKAIEWLRENGIAKAAKKSGRIAAEGTTYISVNGNDAAMVEVNSETDFVAKNDGFKALVKTLADNIVAKKPATLEDALQIVAEDGETLNDKIVNATAKIGEKISLRRFVLVSKNDDEVFGTYLHMGGNKGSIVVVKGSQEVANDMSMQILATVPMYINKEDVESSYVENELRIRLEASKASGRDLSGNQRAVDGLRNKVAEEVALVCQEYIKDDKAKVGQFLKQNNASVSKMVYYVVGEGLEKRNDNFAEEVMNQIK